jgi:protein-S-isoprenylcysteine O-methyltransferase Ste14
MNAMRICPFLWALLWLVWLGAWLRTKKTQELAGFGSRLGYGAPVVVAFYLLFSSNVPFGWLGKRIIPRIMVVEVLAVSLTALGIAFAIWARFYIGQNWSSAVTIKVGHQLIRTGPYAWVRHPIYSGLLLAMIGTALARRAPRGLLAILLLWLGFSIKRRMEEGFMLKTFGPEYEEYSRSTGALIPRLRGLIPHADRPEA